MAHPFAVIEPLPAGQLLRTLVSPEQRRAAVLAYNNPPTRSVAPACVQEADAQAVDQQLVRWSVRRLERLQSAEEEDQEEEEDEDELISQDSFDEAAAQQT